MSRQILVPVTGRDRIEELLPYLEDIARPDTRIIFLLHFGTSRFTELAGRLLEIQSGLPTSFSNFDSVRYSNLTHRLEYVSQALRDRGVKIEVKFHCGPLRQILREYQEVTESTLIIMRSQKRRFLNCLRRLLAVFKLTEPSPVIPVLLCQHAASPGDSYKSYHTIGHAEP
jgi:nucleotide-binding universal stress UspA family protein